MLKSYLIKFNIYILNKNITIVKLNKKVKNKNSESSKNVLFIIILYKLTSLAYVMTY